MKTEEFNLGSIEQNGGEIETGEVFKVYFTGNVTSPSWFSINIQY